MRGRGRGVVGRGTRVEWNERGRGKEKKGKGRKLKVGEC